MIRLVALVVQQCLKVVEAVMIIATSEELIAEITSVMSATSTKIKNKKES
jgi:hypothetical protein